ncbi:hypothetical protein Rsub_03066 [Raphidocelis subcapitata]|uniref:Superoxide dismutase n=1 Tax=Raphidocelis subcapitata TaxID=307507 RepID=A0A2V0P0Z8_9CHLO|nr:hypothetical protein Rsub_03066 [Raphidocelis subcapitata]|eukprot:GBF90765.1 hypothetical protein Rsub_03066 [Raphidocelis subcapitata]
MPRTALGRVGLLALLVAGAQAFSQVKLPVALDGVAPVISNTTMNYHYNKHYAGYIDKLNAAYGDRTPPPSLTAAIKSVGDKATVNASVIQKQGGGAWNHALYFKTLAPPGSAATKEASLSAPLAAAVQKSFGGFEPMKKAVSDAAMGVFGSGWAWLCLQADGALVVATTANQDNPLMGTGISKAPDCTPILGIDVWEHAYYVDHGPARKDYVDNYWSVVNWPQVSANFGSAQSGKIDDIVA